MKKGEKYYLKSKKLLITDQQIGDEAVIIDIGENTVYGNWTNNKEKRCVSICDWVCGVDEFHEIFTNKQKIKQKQRLKRN